MSTIRLVDHDRIEKLDRSGQRELLLEVQRLLRHVARHQLRQRSGALTGGLSRRIRSTASGGGRWSG